MLSSPCSGDIQLDRAVQGHIQLRLEYLQGWRIPKPGWSGLVLAHPHGGRILPYTGSAFLALQFRRSRLHVQPWGQSNARCLDLVWSFCGRNEMQALHWFPLQSSYLWKVLDEEKSISKRWPGYVTAGEQRQMWNPKWHLWLILILCCWICIFAILWSKSLDMSPNIEFLSCCI